MNLLKEWNNKLTVLIEPQHFSPNVVMAASVSADGSAGAQVVS